MTVNAVRPREGSDACRIDGTCAKVGVGDTSAGVIRGSALCMEVMALAAAGRKPEAISRGQEAVEFVRGLLGVAALDDLRLLASRLVQVKETLYQLDRRVEAVQVAHDVVTFRRALATCGDPDDTLALAASLDALTCGLAELGRYAQAAAVAQEQVVLRRVLARGRGADSLRLLANALRTQGRCSGRAGGDADRALAILREALKLLRPLAATSSIDVRPDLARTHFAVATLLGDRGRAAEAVPSGLLAVAMQRELLQADPSHAVPELAKALHNVCIWLSQIGRRREALAAAEEAVSFYRDVVCIAAPDAMRDLTWALVTLGNRLADLQQHERALCTYREAATHLLRLPAHDGDLWAWLASILAARLSEPQDLREFHLPLLCRLGRTRDQCTGGAADALARLQEQVAARARTLIAALPEPLEDELGVLLEPGFGERITRWACAQGAGSRLVALSGAWAAQSRYGDG